MPKTNTVTVTNILDWIFEIKILAKYRTKIGLVLLGISFVMGAMADPLVGILAPEYQAWAIAQAGLATYLTGVGMRFAGQTSRKVKS